MSEQSPKTTAAPEITSARAEFLGTKVAYQIYVRSFQDSNGDGIGDLRGITQRLDYLQKLGIDYLWITPFFVSPQHDNGYDVADYRNIESLFGTMADFDELSAEAKKHGIKLMLDMVFNHTSTDHIWFQRALAGDSKYLAYYKFVDGEPDTPPTNWQSKFGGSAWEWVPSLHKWYLHLYDTSQADLNWDNPEVRAELADVVRFWRDKGVDGFRFDVINVISKPDILEDDTLGDGRRFYTDGPHVHEYLQELVEKSGIDGLMTVGEMSSTSIENCIRYSNPADHELAMVFSFHHLKVDYLNGEKWALKEPDINELRNLLKSWQEHMTAGGGWNALFWANHDQPRPNSRFGDTVHYWEKSSKLLAVTTHLLRGTPYIYQGEELGMTNADFTTIEQYRDVESLNYFTILQNQGYSPEEALHIVSERSRDNSRTPVQWDATKTAGFTSGTPWIGIPENHTTINAAAEVDDPDSVFSFYRQLIAIRKAHPVISEGDVHFIDTAGENIIAYERTLNDCRVLVFANFSDQEVSSVSTDLFNGFDVLIGNYPDTATDAHSLLLRPFEARAFIRSSHAK
ncbi:alpha,alpha-phosphotrehalase [Atopobium sp. oral taxon 199]|uniref:alpha,alpha-phosphotrehalase n=1 Tax=Atopobium sp. oral taxon 199 TaxID=712156 RepID=UPI00034E4220|nr:alpha,alpha-phosphotrehalase [Atopobium sp. oral taxon 199]EPD77374.1 alpha,alpha-phosphotrehalase [Atopobium sp. oral taxon 199 str. F0494]